MKKANVTTKSHTGKFSSYVMNFTDDNHVKMWYRSVSQYGKVVGFEYIEEEEPDFIPMRVINDEVFMMLGPVKARQVFAMNIFDIFIVDSGELISSIIILEDMISTRIGIGIKVGDLTKL